MVIQLLPFIVTKPWASTGSSDGSIQNLHTLDRQTSEMQEFGTQVVEQADLLSTFFTWSILQGPFIASQESPPRGR